MSASIVGNMIIPPTYGQLQWSVLTIERLHTREILLPTQVLAIDLSEVSDEESVFVAGLAKLMIDSLGTALQGLAD